MDFTGMACLDGHDIDEPLPGARIDSATGRVFPAWCPTCRDRNRLISRDIKADRASGRHPRLRLEHRDDGWIVCGDCNLEAGPGIDIYQLECRATSLTKRRVHAGSPECNPRCQNAKGYVCDCRCGGLNHGGG